MKTQNIITLTLFILLFTNCKKELQTTANAREMEAVMHKFDSLDEDIFSESHGKLGVILNINPLGVFKTQTHQFEEKTSTAAKEHQKTLQEFSQEYSQKEKIKSVVSSFLDQHKKSYLFIQDDHETDLNNISEKYAVDDLLIIDVTSGIAQTNNPTEKNNNSAKGGQTYIDVKVLDGKTLKEKYKETLSGTQYLDTSDSSLTEKEKIKRAINNSLDQTLNNISNP
ncbi:hypothetical protein [Weeksella sp. HMSC059D05]|uniref:hypothetical protein n=1 Tax=Weeksella sp. HMSC059D05 TaxID=1715139 RepID=UPI0008A49B81|nr:hypothetical protein [Weeksella sp. HMSC059D05]OFM84497.1 hypothetical protein HMPREF2660_08280 [Weeksella sp. HMSC059D05]